MGELRFDGRTAIVTGAGGNPSLGRLYALLLASRGANVVVNDIGTVPEVPNYEGTASPEAVAEEIRALGGNAVADWHDIGTEEGARAIVETAVAAFGGIDILVNNAALCILAGFAEVSGKHYRRMIETNLMGPAWICRAAWPHMVKQNYGRIINVGAAVFGGNRLMTAYSVSKGGLFMLTQALAMEGHDHGIMVNTVHPMGFSRMVPALQKNSSSLFQTLEKDFPPEQTAPLIGLLAHEVCPTTGECFDTAGGRVNRTLIARNAGHVDRAQTVETLYEHWDAVMGEVDIQIIERNAFSANNWNIRPYREYANG
jgi:NAD(P)-dependent dehydrogenase (short-subunit alcohol dehydrogenase family)